MIDVVSHKLGTVSVRDDLAERVAAVCIKCKGFKTVWVTDCKSRNYPGLDGFYWSGHRELCPMCDGDGLFYSYED